MTQGLVALLRSYLQRGANVAIGYYDEHEDAKETVNRLKEIGVKAKAYAHDLKDAQQSKDLVQQVVQEFGGLNILVNNGAVNILKIVSWILRLNNLKDTFETNIFGMFFLSQAAVPYLSDNDTIINTTSVTAYRGSGHLN